jgi:hypothetical protein
VKLERRSSSIALVAVYTWAKSLDDKSAAAGVGSTNAFAGHMNEHNQALDYGRSDFDVNHRFVTSVVYQLPLGRGKRFGGNMNRAADLAIGGWQITAITTFQKGFPYSILANDNFGLLTTFTQRANLVPGCNPNSGFHKSINEYFNTACFTQPLAGQFGNSGRDILRGPGINNWDMGIGKDFNFTERVAFQFRAEAFNVFNHAQYGYDPNTATSIGAPIDNNPNDAAYGRVLAARRGASSSSEASSSSDLGNLYLISARPAAAWRIFVEVHSPVMLRFFEIRWLAGLVLVCSCVYSATAQSADAIEKYSAEGQQALVQGNYAGAEAASKSSGIWSPVWRRCTRTWESSTSRRGNSSSPFPLCARP